jgi:sugar phosphate isomerase/epimerase
LQLKSARLRMSEGATLRERCDLPSLLPAGVSPEVARDATAEELRRVLPLAEELGVRIAIETCWNGFLDSAEALAAFVDSFDSPQLTGSGRGLLTRAAAAMDEFFA